MTCETCGAAVPGGYAYCPECGRNLAMRDAPGDAEDEQPRRRRLGVALVASTAVVVLALTSAATVFALTNRPTAETTTTTTVARPSAAPSSATPLPPPSRPWDEAAARLITSDRSDLSPVGTGANNVLLGYSGGEAVSQQYVSDPRQAGYKADYFRKWNHVSGAEIDLTVAEFVDERAAAAFEEQYFGASGGTPFALAEVPDSAGRVLVTSTFANRVLVAHRGRFLMRASEYRALPDQPSDAFKALAAEQWKALQA